MTHNTRNYQHFSHLAVACLALGLVSTAVADTPIAAANAPKANKAVKKVVIDDADTITIGDDEFAAIQKTMSGSSPYGNNWITAYGGIVAEPAAIKPAVLIGGLWARDTLKLVNSKGDSVNAPVDITFLRDHWTVAHKVRDQFGLGRFGWTFGVSIGTLGSTSGNTTDNTTDYFFGLTYFINPEMTVALGPVSNASTGFAKCHIAATVSIDLTTIGKFFGK